MAASWVAALKLVPWGDVIEATPQILQAAKKLLGTTQKGNAEAATGALDGAAGETAIPAALQLQHLRDRVAQLEREQQESAMLIQSLAEQHAQVVQAVEVQRRRQQWFTVAVSMLAVACAGLLAWVLTQ